jgi:hypothetical protein
MRISRRDRLPRESDESVDLSAHASAGRPFSAKRFMPMLKSWKPWDREAAFVALLLCGEFPELDAQYAARDKTRGRRALGHHVKALLRVAHSDAPGPDRDAALLEECYRLLREGMPRSTIRRALAFSSVVLPALGTVDLATAEMAAAAADRVVCDRLMPANMENCDVSGSSSKAGSPGARRRPRRALRPLRQRAADRSRLSVNA